MARYRVFCFLRGRSIQYATSIATTPAAVEYPVQVRHNVIAPICCIGLSPKVLGTADSRGWRGNSCPGHSLVEGDRHAYRRFLHCTLMGSRDGSEANVGCAGLIYRHTLLTVCVVGPLSAATSSMVDVDG